jgi:flagellar basal-body rod protein FlgF
MDRGTYAAASGGMAQLRLMDIVANNLANVNTPGYKQDVLVTSEQRFADTLASAIQTDPFALGDHLRTPGALNAESRIDFSLGAMEQTGNPLDVALRNQNDFFVLLTANGTEVTRAGNFRLDSQGQLVTRDGVPVAGDGGAITVQGPGATITPSGGVLAGGVIVGNLQVVRVADTTRLEKIGNNRFRIPNGGAGQPVIPDVASGVLERANISMTSAMVQMIQAHRGFEAYTKVASTIDEMNRDATSRIVVAR